MPTRPRILDRFPGMTIGVAQLRRIDGLDSCGVGPIRWPRPPSAFLAARIDRDSLVGGMRAARRIVSPALQPFVRGAAAPESTGSIHAVSADPLAAPPTAFLAARIDRDSLVGGMRAARIVSRPALQPFVRPS